MKNCIIGIFLIIIMAIASQASAGGHSASVNKHLSQAFKTIKSIDASEMMQVAGLFGVDMAGGATFDLNDRGAKENNTSKGKSIRIMDYNVPVNSLRVLGDLVVKQKISITIRF